MKWSGEVKVASSFPRSEGDVHLLELVEAGQHARARHAAENVGTGALHQGHEYEALVPQHPKTFELQHEGLLSRCALLVYY